MNTERPQIVLRRRAGVETKIVVGSYEMATVVAKPVVNIFAKAKAKVTARDLRRDVETNLSMGGPKHLNKAEKELWCFGLRIVRREGVQGGSRFSFNEMVKHLVAFGYPRAINV